MNALRQFFTDWFGYSRRERRASLILVFIIIIVLLIRYLVPEKRIDFSVNTIAPPVTTVNPGINTDNSSDSIRLFNFDPNSATFKDMTSLGIPDKVAATLIKYRNSGGRFRKADDILKVYGMDSILAGKLIPYINISGVEDTPVKKKNETGPLQVSETEYILPKIEINKCDSSEFEALPGIGRILASRIIKYRELLGGYASVKQLKEVYGLPDSTYQVISVRCIADSSLVRKIKLNSASFSELNRHPYIERYEAQAIIKYRDLTGRVRNISQLVNEKILTGDKAGKLTPYLVFD